MNGDPEVLGAADPLTALVEMLRLHGRLDAEEANALDRAHLAAFHSAEASAIPDWMLRNHKAVQVPIREPEWESVAGDQWTPRRESQRSCGGTIASGLQSGRPCSLRARPGSAYCKRHEPKPFAVAMPAGLRRTEQDVQHLRDDLWRERVAAGGLGATGSSAYELGWHAGFGDAVEALDVARDSRPVGAEKMALDAGTHEPAVDDFGNQYLSPRRPGPSQALRLVERLASDLHDEHRGPGGPTTFRECFHLGCSEASAALSAEDYSVSVVGPSADD